MWLGVSPSAGSCTCRQRIMPAGVNRVNSSPFTVVKGDAIMTPNVLFEQLLIVALVLISRLGKFVELLPAAYGLHMGINISRICSHLWPRASRDAAHRNSPASAFRAIARAFCPTVITPCANANLSEADGDVDAR